MTGSCAIDACSAGFDDCNGDPADGCEQSLDTLDHCGTCGTCGSAIEGAATCATGTCEVATCNPWFGDCNQDPGDGCEQDLRFDSNHCGDCGTFCNPPTDQCANGSCF